VQQHQFENHEDAYVLGTKLPERYFTSHTCNASRFTLLIFRFQEFRSGFESSVMEDIHSWSSCIYIASIKVEGSNFAVATKFSTEKLK